MRAVPRIRPVFFGENASYDILIDVDAKGSGDLLGDSGTAKPGIPAFHLQDELDELRGGSFGSRFSLSL